MDDLSCHVARLLDVGDQQARVDVGWTWPDGKPFTPETPLKLDEATWLALKAADAAFDAKDAAQEADRRREAGWHRKPTETGDRGVGTSRPASREDVTGGTGDATEDTPAWMDPTDDDSEARWDVTKTVGWELLTEEAKAEVLAAGERKGEVDPHTSAQACANSEQRAVEVADRELHERAIGVAVSLARYSGEPEPGYEDDDAAFVRCVALHPRTSPEVRDLLLLGNANPDA